MDDRRKIVFSSPTAASSCIFCKIISGLEPASVVYEDAKYIGFLDAFPFSLGHTLVCPKRHGETIWDMDEGEIAELFRAASRVSKAVVGAVEADGFKFVQNNGEAANQVVAHVHIHVIPVKMEDRGRSGDRRRFTEQEMKDTATEIRKLLGGRQPD